MVSTGLAREARIEPPQLDPVSAGQYVIRPARAEEIDAILAIFEGEVRAGRMLPRTPYEIRIHLDDWLVAATGDGEVAGCVSLVFFNHELCEVRSLAVHVDHRGQGLGSELILAAIELARLRGMERVLTLTRATGLFEGLGFRYNYVANFPEKVWRDCRPCPLRHRCDEVALIYHLRPPGKRGHHNGTDS